MYNLHNLYLLKFLLTFHQLITERRNAALKSNENKRIMKKKIFLVYKKYKK